MTEDLNRAAAYCPTCGAEYCEGFDVCADDGTPLLPGPVPPEPVMAPEPEMAPVAPGTGARWVPVRTYMDMNEARLFAGRLEAEGIAAVLDPPAVGDYYGEAAGVLLAQGIKVLVPEDRALDARAVLEELDRA